MDQTERKDYREPEVVDYGTLVELTAAHVGGHHEDGIHKGPDPSHPHGK
jgi:hypothetical protein